MHISIILSWYEGTKSNFLPLVDGMILLHHGLTHSFSRNISKTSASVSSDFQTRESFETTRPQPEWFYCILVFGIPMKHEARVFEITSPTEKISLNYHFNKFSQFNYYI